jgi:hypothetical protein
VGSWWWVVLAALYSTSARAADEPVVWGRLFTAVALQPGGAIVDVASELRAPVMRYGGVAFNDTFVGGGARVALTPAHLDTALRATIQPIDLLPITVELVRSTYWESPWGLVPIDRITDIRLPGRQPLYEADRDFAGGAWILSVSPTFQVRAGPLVGFSNVTVSFLRIRPEQGPEPWVFEPFRGLALGYNDRVLEHTSALLWQPLDGEEAPLLRLGAALRGKNSHATGDTALTLGGIAQWRPGETPRAPTFLLLVTPYLRDPDFVGPAPYVAFVVTFEREQSLKDLQ